MDRYRSRRSIAATLPRALPDTTVLSAGDGLRRARRFLPFGLTLFTAAVLVFAAIAIPLLRRDGRATPRPSAAPPDRAVIHAVAMSQRPLTMALDAGTRRVLVAGDSGNAGAISILDATTGALVTTIGVASDPQAIAVDARGGRAFVASQGVLGPIRSGTFSGGAVTILDTRSVHVIRAIRRSALAVAVDEGTGHVFVTDGSPYARSHGRLAAGQIAMLDETGRVLRAFFLGPYPAALAVDSLAGRVFATTFGPFPKSPGAVSILDARTGRLIRAIPVGPSPMAIVVDAARRRAFVINSAFGTGSAYLSVLDTGTGRLVRTVPIAGAEALALSAGTGRVFVRTFFNTVAVLDARSGQVVKIVPVDQLVRYALSPTAALAVDERRRRVFVPGDRRTIVLDAATGRVLRTLTVPGYLVAVNGGNGRAFVANQDMPAPPTSGFFTRSGAPTTPHVFTLDLSRR